MIGGLEVGGGGWGDDVMEHLSSLERTLLLFWHAVMVSVLGWQDRVGDDEGTVFCGMF